MRKDNRLARLFTVALLAVFVNFMFMNTVFTHTHRLADGSVVCHSHPYQHSETHSHSTSLLSLISSFNGSVSAFQGTAAVALALMATLTAVVYLSTPALRIFSESNFFSLRAPPVLI